MYREFGPTAVPGGTPESRERSFGLGTPEPGGPAEYGSVHKWREPGTESRAVCPESPERGRPRLAGTRPARPAMTQHEACQLMGTSSKK